MKQIKIVDTVPTYGQAERYISLAMDFKKFMWRNFGKISKIDINEIISKFHLKGIVFGNYTTQEERYFFLFKLQNQLELLAKIKGNNNLGLGILTVAFGSEGKSKSNAHFAPDRLLINISRGRKTNYNSQFKGENSFVHEYFHFVDFIIGRSDAKFNENFASEARAKAEQANIKIENIRLAVHQLYIDKDYGKDWDKRFSQKYIEYLQNPIEMFARLSEATITAIVQTDKKYANYIKHFPNSYQRDDRYYQQKEIFQHKLDARIKKALKDLNQTMVKTLKIALPKFRL